jgi:hypothetical protein
MKYDEVLFALTAYSWSYAESKRTEMKLFKNSHREG